MAGDWIKLRNDIYDDPSVILIAATTGIDEYGVVGRLGKLWAWADRQSRDGHADAVTEVWIDRYVGVNGFALAMAKAGWLHVGADGVTFPKFDRHNGKSAKNRALATDRQAEKRSRSVRDESVTREEKRREEEKQSAARAPEASPSTPTPPQEAAPAGKPTPSDYVKLLGPHGIATNVFDQVLIGWALSEIPAARIEEAIVIAKRRKGDERIHTRYLDPIVRDPTASTSPAPASKSGKDQADAKLARTAAQVAEQARWEAAPMPDSLRGFVHKAGSA